MLMLVDAEEGPSQLVVRRAIASVKFQKRHFAYLSDASEEEEDELLLRSRKNELTEELCWGGEYPWRTGEQRGQPNRTICSNSCPGVTAFEIFTAEACRNQWRREIPSALAQRGSIGESLTIQMNVIKIYLSFVEGKREPEF